MQAGPALQWLFREPSGNYFLLFPDALLCSISPHSKFLIKPWLHYTLVCDFWGTMRSEAGSTLFMHSVNFTLSSFFPPFFPSAISYGYQGFLLATRSILVIYQKKCANVSFNKIVLDQPESSSAYCVSDCIWDVASDRSMDCLVAGAISL